MTEHKFEPRKTVSTDEQAVLIYLSNSLPQETYNKYDLGDLEDQLRESINAKSAGEFDGNEIGADTVCLFMYGKDANALYNAIKSTLAAHPLCQNGRDILRFGSPGAEEQELMIGHPTN